MKGYYVIPRNGEPIEVVGVNARDRAINTARNIHKQDNDDEIIVQQFDDNNDGGYMSNLECLYIKDILDH